MLLIKNAYIVDPEAIYSGFGQILIKDGKIEALLKPKESVNMNLLEGVIDASGCHVIPSFVDMHAHFRDPGYEHKEDIESGMRAAIAGGFGYVCTMANTSPVNDNPLVTQYMLRKANNLGIGELIPIGAVTINQKGKKLCDLNALKKAGCRGFSDDGMCITDSLLFKDALSYTKLLQTPLIEHAEDPGLNGFRGINDGIMAAKLGIEGSPSVSEASMVARDVEILRSTGGILHITHISAMESLKYIEMAKSQKLSISADVTPHHLLLTEDAVDGFCTTAKVNPPLRTKEDKEALLSAIASGIIDAIATDHAPHSINEKQTYFTDAPSGIIGLESAFPVLYTLVESGKLSIERLAYVLSISPGKIVGIQNLGLNKGSVGSFGIWEIDDKKRVLESPKYSKSSNCPFTGWNVKPILKKFIFQGRLVYES